MALSEVDIRLIEKYIREELTLEEQIAFEGRKNDPAFIEELALYSAIKKSTTDISRTEIRENFVAWDQEGTAKRKPVLPAANWWKIAAVLLILAGIIGLLNRFSHTPNPQDLFTQYYQPYPNLIDPIQKGAASTPSLSQSYELGNYQEVFDQIPSDSLETFYVALSRIQVKQYKAALPVLQKLATNEDYRFQEAAQWYFALALLADNQIALSKEVLTEISINSRHDFQDLAQGILNQLPD